MLESIQPESGDGYLVSLMPITGEVLQSSTLLPEMVEGQSILLGNQALQVMVCLAIGLELSGGGQGKAPKPVNKIRGSRWWQKILPNINNPRPPQKPKPVKPKSK